jgi:hypothetical protein
MPLLSSIAHQKLPMNISSRIAITALAVFSLSACTPMLVKTHPDTPPEKVAKLKSASLALDHAAYKTQFSMYAIRQPNGGYGEFVQVGNTWTGFPQQLEIPEGSYLLSVQCATSSQFGYLRMPVTLAGGAEYEISCEPADGRLNTVVGHIKRLN